jgi:fibro-slime domain-containing protein
VAIGAGCAGVKPAATPTTGTGGSGAGTGTGTGGSGNHPFDAGAVDVPTTITMTCGNGVLDPGEKCDDHNMMGGDGCSKICQVENGWICSTPGQACTRNVKCGDGVITSPEVCDDGNTNPNDGCSADCKTVEPGWQCRVQGKPCVPLCGDSKITGGEGCDDGNTNSGDGCSSTCQLEPGATCVAPGEKCSLAVCGNGMAEAGEACDCGTDSNKLPVGCTGPNGLFNGDGSGCSKTCTKEPSCRDASGKTQACATTCGNGSIEPGEDCDDGNTKDGDGCSSKCKVETGFTCTTVQQSDAVDCTQAVNAGLKCLELPIKYRDFKNESVTGGHPDFFYLGTSPIAVPVAVSGVQGQGASTNFNKRYCVSNSAGPAKKNDSVNRCWDLASPTLAANGKPSFNMSRTGINGNPFLCDCQFIDWDHNGNGNNVPGYGDATAAGKPLSGLTYVQGETQTGSPMYRGPAPVVASAASFSTWFIDASDPGHPTTAPASTYLAASHTIGTLELASTGSNNQYQFSSQPNAILGGFFPLDPPGQYPMYGVPPAGPGTVRTVNGEQLLCNIWPYWYSATNFGAGAGCKGNQYLFPPSLMTSTTPPYTAANWSTTVNMMYPNGTWYDNSQGWYHDSWFSDEARYLFAFNGPFSLQFYGDDDMFIYINGQLVIDLGGVHQRLPGQVSVDASGVATIIEGGSLDANGAAILPCATTTQDPYTMLHFNTQTNTDGNGHSNCTNNQCDCRSRTLNLGLSKGSTYEIAIFGADRHPTESNFQLTLSGFETNQSQCNARCGDGVVTGAEECDCGDGTGALPAGCTAPNTAGMYNGCDPKTCKYGPFCGDGTIESDGGEQCDDGPANGIGYSATCGKGCSSNCQTAHCCGDTIVDADEGEECDLGSANGTKGASCDASCKLVIILDNGL